MSNQIDIVAIRVSDGKAVCIAYSDNGGPDDREFIDEFPAPEYRIERMPVGQAVALHMASLQSAPAGCATEGRSRYRPPVRLQRRRSKGWRMPENTVSVTRPGRWGNHWSVYDAGGGRWMVTCDGIEHGPFPTKRAAAEKAVELFRHDVVTPGEHHHQRVSPVPTATDVIKGLRGRNVACCCALDEPCHGDVLIEIANAPLAGEPGLAF